MSEYEDEGEECEQHVVMVEQLPSWRFSAWDIAGLALTGVGGVFSVLGQVGHLMAREFAAAANYQRQERDLRVAYEQEMAEREARAQELRLLVDGPEEN